MSIFDKADALCSRIGDWMGDSISRMTFVFIGGISLLTLIICLPLFFVIDNSEPLECPPGSTMQVTESTAGRGTTRVYTCVAEFVR